MTTHAPFKKPMVLIILDGFGISPEKKHNAIALAETPHLDALLNAAPHIPLEASGLSVGLPEGQMGNSEVGHLHIGSGRKVPQDLVRIDAAIGDGSFFKNPVIIDALQSLKKSNGAVHILGLLSPGGVHSRDDHMAAMIEMVHQHGIQKNYCHAILDGRDTPPQSALPSIEKINALYAKHGTGKIASLIGRYYAMDRDKRWERTKAAYDLLTLGDATYTADTAAQGLALAYENNKTDEFVPPTAIHKANESPITVQDGDLIIFMNFRADRARQLSYAFTDPAFNAFHRTKVPQLSAYLTLTEYAENLNASVIFSPLLFKNTLGEHLSRLGYTQLRLAETEKYAHVTYFLNGGEEKAFPGEDRSLVPSPKVATYDLKPEMSALEVTDKLIEAIKSGRYDFIACNFANPDMVGHTGSEAATQTAITLIDSCLGRIVASLKQFGGEALITADHGNAEKMYDEQTKQAHTAHTCNPVPLIYIGRPAQFHASTGALDDVAPTLLYLMGLPIPPEMTGNNLITLK